MHLDPLLGCRIPVRHWLQTALEHFNFCAQTGKYVAPGWATFDLDGRLNPVTHRDSTAEQRIQGHSAAIHAPRIDLKYTYEFSTRMHA